VDAAFAGFPFVLRALIFAAVERTDRVVVSYVLNNLALDPSP
jgi:hypothetical protein